MKWRNSSWWQLAVVRRSLWFIWEKLIDSLTLCEKHFAVATTRSTLLHDAVWVEETHLQCGRCSWASPVAAHRGSYVTGSAHYLASVAESSEQTLCDREQSFPNYFVHTSFIIMENALWYDRVLWFNWAPAQRCANTLSGKKIKVPVVPLFTCTSCELGGQYGQVMK